MKLRLQNIFYHVVHLAVIFLATFAWMFESTREVHFYLMQAILFSWLGLGYFYGLGYCLLTDLHWRVKKAMGEANLPPAYVFYVLRSIGIALPPKLVDSLTSLAFVVFYAIAMWFRFG